MDGPDEATPGGKASAPAGSWMALVHQALRRQGRPRVVAGIRAGALVAAPLLVCVLIGDKVPGELVSLGALQAAIVDAPVPYRRRASVLVATGISCGAAMAVGSLSGIEAWLAVLVTGSWCGVSAYSGAFGSSYEAVGLVSAVLLLFGLAKPAGPAGAFEHAGLVAVGVAWVAAWALLPWPWRRDRPATVAVAAMVRSGATTLHQLALDARQAVSSNPVTLETSLERWAGTVGTLRDRIVNAKSAVDATYGQGRSDLPLVRLTFACERLADRATAMRESLRVVEHATGEHAGRVISGAVEVASSAARRLDWCASALAQHPASPGERRIGLWLAQRVRGRVRATRRAWPSIDPALQALGDVYERMRVTTPAVDGVHDVSILVRAVDRLADSVEVVTHLATATPSHREVMPSGVPRISRIADTLRPHLAWQAPRTRLALRLGVVTALSQALVVSAGISHGLWLILTLLVILRAEQSVTFTRSLQRITGTVAGSVVAAVLLAWVSNDLVLVALVAVLLAACIALLTVNYLYVVVFLTPVALMIVDLAYPAGPTVAGVRTGLTLLGGALSLAATVLLWPVREADQLPARLGAVIKGTGRYLDKVLGVAESDSGTASVQRDLGAARGEAMTAYARLRDLLESLLLGSPGQQREAARWAPAVLAGAELLRSELAASDALDEEPTLTESSSQPRLAAATRRYRGAARGVFANLAEMGSGPADGPGATCEPATANGIEPLPVPDDLLGAVDDLYAERARQLAAGKGIEEPSTLRRAVRQWHAIVRLVQRVDDETGRLAAALHPHAQPVQRAQPAESMAGRRQVERKHGSATPPVG